MHHASPIVAAQKRTFESKTVKILTKERKRAKEHARAAKHSSEGGHEAGATTCGRRQRRGSEHTVKVPKSQGQSQRRGQRVRRRETA